MHTTNRTICLFIDNFSSHNIAYEPTNVQVEWFKPNLTSHVQPLDTGIIRCFKAHYHRTFCIRALDCDNAGERDIYNINLLEAMLMAREAWDAVSATMIKNCWDHTGIQCSPIMLHVPLATKFRASFLARSSAGNNSAAWDIIEQFATTEMALPDVENALQKHLGAGYIDSEWWPAFKVVMDAEGDAALALAAVKTLQLKLASSSGSSTRMTTAEHPNPPHADTAQCRLLEEDLLNSITELKQQNHIHGDIPTLEDILDLKEELEIGRSPYLFEGGDADIVAQVLHEQAVA
jgi:hypothetical protein